MPTNTQPEKFCAKQADRLWERYLSEEGIFNDRLNFFLLLESILLSNEVKKEFLDKAKENLKAAELLFNNQLYNASVNRAYYAAFQAAIAALANISIEVEQISHEATQANFALELIQRRKIYPSHLIGRSTND